MNAGQILDVMDALKDFEGERMKVVIDPFMPAPKVGQQYTIEIWTSNGDNPPYDDFIKQIEETI